MNDLIRHIYISSLCQDAVGVGAGLLQRPYHSCCPKVASRQKSAQSLMEIRNDQIQSFSSGGGNFPRAFASQECFHGEFDRQLE
ncbi:hypothetical protein [Comamonas koreensis]|uniref:hypothetical protein n=1 Tax=Comamonas koreensis TaxID=160825 RepID=UPI0015F7F60B|nr:hypothetical protein [Comamonas koreensis]